jgi:hypothetical protein
MKSILTVVTAALALTSTALLAGTAATGTVSVKFDTPDSGFAEGTMWNARSSDDDVQAIGCSYKGVVEPVHYDYFPWEYPVNNWAWCRARDADGVQVFCFTDDPHLLDALQAVSAFSYVGFEFAKLEDLPGLGLTGLCTRLDISTQSLHLPEFQTKKKN